MWERLLSSFIVLIKAPMFLRLSSFFVYLLKCVEVKYSDLQYISVYLWITNQRLNDPNRWLCRCLLGSISLLNIFHIQNYFICKESARFRTLNLKITYVTHRVLLVATIENLSFLQQQRQVRDKTFTGVTFYIHLYKRYSAI